MLKIKASRPSVTVGAILTIALSLAACQGGATAKPAASGRTFIYAVPSVAQNLDPGMWEGDPGRWTKWDQGSTLFDYDPTKVNGDGCKDLATTQDVKLELAESWTLSPDSKYYTVSLRNAKSPYGHTLSSADVKWSFARNSALSGVSRNMYFTQAKYEKDAIEVIDEKTFKLHIERPTAMDKAINTIGPFALGIYDSTEAKSHATPDDPWAKKWLSNHTANYGPWQAESFDPGNEVVYKKNPNYFGKRGNIDKLVIRGIPESSTRLQLLQSGDIDATNRLTFDEYASLGGHTNIDVKHCLSPIRDTVVLQGADKRFADPMVRKAVSFAIDRDALVKTAYRGIGTPSVTGLPAAYGAPSSGESLRYDPVKAVELLGKAGYPNGFTAPLTISSSRPGPHAEQVAIQLKSQLAKVGIVLDIKVVGSASDFATQFQDGKYVAMLYLDPPAVADPLYTLVNYNETKAAQNTFKYSSKDYDASVAKLATILEPGAERDALLKHIDAIIMSDMPMIYLVDRTYDYALRSGLKGFFNAPSGELQSFRISK